MRFVHSFLNGKTLIGRMVPRPMKDAATRANFVFEVAGLECSVVDRIVNTLDAVLECICV